MTINLALKDRESLRPRPIQPRVEVVLTLEQLADPSDEECVRFDIAEVDLACAVGLPGSERLDVAACLAKLDDWAAWVHRYTKGIYEEFIRRPDCYDDSEAIFRVMCLITVLQKGAGVRYNPARIEDPDVFKDARDSFIHGIIDGPGGTCASLPILYIAVGRRLGYPFKLVPSKRHFFARWEDSPGGKRFNIECTTRGLTTYPDEHYLGWQIPTTKEEHREFRYLRSLTPREEIAVAWRKRGFILHANGQIRDAIRSFATTCSLAPDDRLNDWTLWRALNLWRDELHARIPSRTPRLDISFPRKRRYPGLPVEIERKIIGLEVLESLLSHPNASGAQVVTISVSE